MQLRAEADAYVWEEVDMAQLVTEAYERAWPLAQARRIDLALELPEPSVPDDDGVCWMYVEPRLLGRALLNLIDNAIKYGPEGSRVDVGLAWRPNAPAVITVSDQGEGIAAEDLPRLFSRYGRLGRQGQSTGHGLGLSLVKTVAERHGATIHCSSVPDVGSVFTLTLPGGLCRAPGA
jgi:signal transduction histidine kinase